MLDREQLLTFGELSKALPIVGGKRIHSSTLWRWALRGCRGVRLESIRLGARYLSSIEAVQRYGARVAEASAATIAERDAHRAAVASAAKPEPVEKSTSRERRLQMERADRELAAAGI